MEITATATGRSNFKRMQLCARGCVCSVLNNPLKKTLGWVNSLSSGHIPYSSDTVSYSNGPIPYSSDSFLRFNDSVSSFFDLVIYSIELFLTPVTLLPMTKNLKIKKSNAALQ